MDSKPITARAGLLARWAAAALLAAGLAVGPARAQTPTGGAPANVASPIPTTYPLPGTETPAQDGGVVQAGCASCGGGLSAPYSSGGCSTCGGDGGCASGCYPGRRPCGCCCNAEGPVGRFFCGLYECICCPDPCYEPHWLAVADSAFFVDSARPVTQMRIRTNFGQSLKDPDRAEYFWAKEGIRPQQIVVDQTRCTTAGLPGKGPNCVARTVDYDDLSVYTEAAVGAFSMFTEIPYRHVEPTEGIVDPLLGADGDRNVGIPDRQATNCCPHSGFADINVGTKAVFLDCEMLLFTFQFKTFIPVGVAAKGLGTGHVSLEPSFLWTMKVTCDDYIQGQSAYWIPIGGDPAYQSPIWHNHASWNHVLWCPCPDFKIVGTAEINEWTIFEGHYTSPDGLATTPPAFPVPRLPGQEGLLVSRTYPAAVSADTTIVSAGPGVRAFICDKIDFGVGSAFALTGSRWEQSLIRAEFRIRY